MDQLGDRLRHAADPTEAHEIAASALDTVDPSNIDTRERHARFTLFIRSALLPFDMSVLACYVLGCNVSVSALCVVACFWISFAAGGNGLEQAGSNSYNNNLLGNYFFDIQSVCDKG